MINTIPVKGILLVLAAGLFLSGCAPIRKTVSIDQEQTQAGVTVDDFEFGNPKRSAHHESNTPAHGSVLPALPINVVIDFNFDLAKPSAISITSAGVEYGEGETIIDTNKLAMRRKVGMDAPDGLYSVTYKACWPDGSCHDGNFQFAVDQSIGGSYVDMTGQSRVEIGMTGYAFVPQKIKVSRGTTVTWTNNDSAGHYVNTDAHPAHTYFPAQNSKLLNKGDSFSLVFEEPGIYPYHCSAHTQMTGAIWVE